MEIEYAIMFFFISNDLLKQKCHDRSCISLFYFNIYLKMFKNYNLKFICSVDMLIIP